MLWLGPFPRRAAASPTRKTKHTSNYVGRVQLGNLFDQHSLLHVFFSDGTDRGKVVKHGHLQLHGSSNMVDPSLGFHHPPVLPSSIPRTRRERKRCGRSLSLASDTQTPICPPPSHPAARQPKTPCFCLSPPDCRKGQCSPPPREREGVCALVASRRNGEDGAAAADWVWVKLLQPSAVNSDPVGSEGCIGCRLLL